MCFGGGVTPSLAHLVPQVLQGLPPLPQALGSWERRLAVPLIEQEPSGGHLWLA